MEQHHIGLGQQAVLSGGRAQKEGSGVHPGWYSMPVIDFESTQEQDDSSRFHAFMQLLRTAGALDRAATDVLADLDLTAGAFGALLELGEVTPGGLAPSELARRLCVARRTATLYVDILERQGWAMRQAHPDDRRMVLATLTPAGLHLINELGDAYKRRLASLLTDMSALTADRLRQILASIDAEQAIRLANQA
jgi:DNA-binding MarR family transcriptional regulator